MLSIEHLEDYLTYDHPQNGFSISFDVEGHRRLNHQVKLPFNLNKGYSETNCSRDEEDHKTIEILLEYLIAKSPDRDLSKVLNGATVVSRRGVLGRMAAGRQLKEKGDWQIVCERRNGVIFIEEEDTEGKRRANRQMSDADKRASYMGNRFEECLLLPVSQGNSALSSSKADLRMVIRAELTDKTTKRGYTLLYSGEVDAIDKDGNYIEMKTQKKALNGYWFWKEKSLKWWLQCKLVGIERLVVGIKNSGGFVGQLQKISTDSLENSQWDGEKCLDFLLETLQFLDQKVAEGASCRVFGRNGTLSCQNSSRRIVSQEFVDHFSL